MNGLNFCDAIWCYINTADNALYLIGVVYRSPNSTDDNNRKLLSMFETINTMHFQHLMIMGDFNLPAIDYNNMTVGSDEESIGSKFFDITQDIFLFQHVTFNTRYRLGNRPSMLDYVFSNEEDM